MKTSKYLIGLDLSASQNVWNLADVETGEILFKKEVSQGAFYASNPNNPKDDTRVLDSYRTDLPLERRAGAFVLDEARRFLDAAREESGLDVRREDIAGIGISVAGKVFSNGRDGGDILFLGGNTPERFGLDIGGGQKAISIARDLRAEFPGISLVGGNDCNSTGNAQSFVYQRNGRNPRKTFYVTISTGVGGGGPVDDVDEMGHVPVSNVHPAVELKCGCGMIGCLEAYASGTGIANLTMRILDLHKDRNRFDEFASYEVLGGRAGGGVRSADDFRRMVLESPLYDMRRKGGEITSKDVCRHLDTDSFATYVLDTTARMTAGVIAGVAQIHDLNVVGIGGGVGENNPGYVKRIQDHVNRLVPKGRNKLLPNGIVVEIGPLGTVANDYGALSLVVPDVYRDNWAATMMARAAEIRKTDIFSNTLLFFR